MSLIERIGEKLMAMTVWENLERLEARVKAQAGQLDELYRMVGLVVMTLGGKGVLEERDIGLLRPHVDDWANRKLAEKLAEQEKSE